MKTRVERVDPSRPDERVLAEAGAILAAGGLVAFPTETVYGLGAHALDVRAVQRLFDAKGRPATNPIIVHVPDEEQARNLAADWPADASFLARAFWPGPLTLVVPRAPTVPSIVTAGAATVALRVPAHPVALELLRHCGLPIAAPSANRSSHLSPTRAEHVLADLDGRIDLLLDGGPTPGGLESTVLDLTCLPPRILRPGLLAAARIEMILGPVLRPSDIRESNHPEAKDRPSEALPSPGLLPRHYAPAIPLDVAPGDGWLRVLELCRQGQRVGWLTYRSSRGENHPQAVIVRLAPDVASYSSGLYAALRFLESARLASAPLDRIVVDTPPQGDDWLAVHDRLRRASAP